MSEVHVPYKQLVIKGSLTPVYVPPTLVMPASGELAIVLAEPMVAERRGDLVKIDAAIAATANALGITDEAARKRIVRAIRNRRLTDLGKRGARNALRADLFYRWLSQEKEQMGDESEESDREEIERRIQQARAEKRRNRGA